MRNMDRDSGAALNILCIARAAILGEQRPKKLINPRWNDEDQKNVRGSNRKRGRVVTDDPEKSKSLAASFRKKVPSGSSDGPSTSTPASSKRAAAPSTSTTTSAKNATIELFIKSCVDDYKCGYPGESFARLRLETGVFEPRMRIVDRLGLQTLAPWAETLGFAVSVDAAPGQIGVECGAIAANVSCRFAARGWAYGDANLTDNLDIYSPLEIERTHRLMGTIYDTVDTRPSSDQLY